MILAPRRGACAVCGAKHRGDEPHEIKSLYYQNRFYREHGRFATRDDAAAPLSGAAREQYGGADGWMDAD